MNESVDPVHGPNPTTRRVLQEMPDDWSRVLAVAAHPDDLEYGVAAAVARWTDAGREVSYLLVTRGEAGIAGLDPSESATVREAEERAGAAVVGVSDVRFLDHRDGVVVEGLDLRRDLAREIRRARPDLVVGVNHHDTFSPGAWNSADHRAVGRSLLDAVAAAGNEWIFPELVGAGFAPWSPRYVAMASSPQATHAVDVSASVERAVSSLAEHRAYLAALADEPVVEQARQVIRSTTGGDDGPARVEFELFG